jgi:HK97 family phage major capsid protein
MKIIDSHNMSARCYLRATEEKNYSLLNAIRVDCRRQGIRIGKDSGTLEHDVSENVRRDLKCLGSGFSMPPDIVFGTGRLARGMVAGSPSAGGYLVGDTALPLVDYVQEASAVSQLGAVTLGGLDSESNPSGSIFHLPDVRTLGSANWADETEQDPGLTLTFGQNALSSHRLTATIPMTTQFLAQSGAGAEAWARRLIGSAFGATVDSAGLAGAGGKQPIGLLYKDGVTVVSNGSDGAALTLAKLCEVEDAVIGSRVAMQGAGYILSKATREKAKQIAKATGTSSFLVETVNGEDRCNGYRSFASTYLPDNLTKGSGSSLGSLIAGDFRYLAIVWLGSVDLVIDPFTRKREGIVEVTMQAGVDIVATKADAFARCVDVVNT